jgi:RNA polymerase sigma-B factor
VEVICLDNQRREDTRLFHAYRRSGDLAARDALIQRFLPLARSLARRYARSAEPLDDLEQVASLALIKAIDAFDVQRGTAFSSYAVPCIAGALKRHFRDACWAVRPPRELQELALEVTRLNDELSAATGTPPTVAQIAEHAGVDIEAILEAREASRALHASSLDRPSRDGDGEESDSVLDTLGAPDGELRRALDRVALDALISTLEEREQVIVRLYYREELTQSEIGEQLGYSQMHISRILRGAIAQLLSTATHQQEQGQRSAPGGLQRLTLASSHD